MKYTSTPKGMIPRAVFLKSDVKPINRPFSTARLTLKSAQLKMTSFVKTIHSKVKRPFERKSVAKNKVWSLTVRPKILIVGLKVPTAKPAATADKGNKGKAVKASAQLIWKPKQTSYGQESERLKRTRIQLDKERSKKLKTTKASRTQATQEQQSEEPKELSEEELKKMMELIPVEELYIEALQKIDSEDLDKLWSLVKKTCSAAEVTNEKEKELWVELKRLYEPDSRDPLWALQRMPPKRTSTSVALTMTQAAIRQFNAGSVTAALEAQAATMTSTEISIETPVQEKLL
uniref:Uncharacterized protein n=1 Tax=Tanacetum cinerariifolium TaxID=118510 RepID=A0A6L2J6X7_TANCI|nr:hypothetical protein [Tanacetum cinerariifolium]